MGDGERRSSLEDMCPGNCTFFFSDFWSFSSYINYIMLLSKTGIFSDHVNVKAKAKMVIYMVISSDYDE